MFPQTKLNQSKVLNGGYGGAPSFYPEEVSTPHPDSPGPNASDSYREVPGGSEKYSEIAQGLFDMLTLGIFSPVGCSKSNRAKKSLKASDAGAAPEWCAKVVVSKEEYSLDLQKAEQDCQVDPTRPLAEREERFFNCAPKLIEEGKED